MDESKIKKYWVLTMSRDRDGVALSGVPTSGAKAYKYSKGISLTDVHPKDAASGIYYDPNLLDNIKLYDFVTNLNGLIIANSKAKAVLDSFEIDNLEYLSSWLYDHQKAVASKDYAIINVLGSVDVIDMKKSICVMDPITETQVQFIKKLVLDYDKIPNDAKIFRATTKLKLFLIRDDIKQAFEAAGLAGYKVFEAEGWNGNDWSM
jgi:hypothetical protein